MDYPDWARTIFENEFELEEDQSPEQEAEDWLDEFVVGDTFEEFYDRQVRNADSTKYSAGQNRAYSIREDPFNCEGQAAVAALAGELVYDRDLELVVDWDLGQQRGNPHRRVQQPQIFNGHVAVRDEDGNTYGGTSLMKQPQAEELDKIAGIYLTNMADEARFNDERDSPESYLSKLDMSIKSQYAGARRRIVESRT